MKPTQPHLIEVKVNEIHQLFYLCRWWPPLNLKRLHEKLSAAEVEVRMAVQNQ